MLILAKSVLSLMIGILVTIVLGMIIVPILRKSHIQQRVSVYLENAHKKKDGTPTMGGIIFIIGAFISILTLLFISHDRYFINKLAEKIIYIEDETF